MLKSLPGPRVWFALAAIFLAAGFVAGCSAMPVTQGTLEEVQADQAAQAQAAEEGNLFRTVLFSLSALAGSVGVAVRRQRKYDEAPFEGEVGGRKVSVQEGEVVAAVEHLRKEGHLKS